MTTLEKLLGSLIERTMEILGLIKGTHGIYDKRNQAVLTVTKEDAKIHAQMFADLICYGRTMVKTTVIPPEEWQEILDKEKPPPCGEG